MYSYIQHESGTDIAPERLWNNNYSDKNLQSEGWKSCKVFIRILLHTVLCLLFFCLLLHMKGRKLRFRVISTSGFRYHSWPNLVGDKTLLANHRSSTPQPFPILSSERDGAETWFAGARRRPATVERQLIPETHSQLQILFIVLRHYRRNVTTIFARMTVDTSDWAQIAGADFLLKSAGLWIRTAALDEPRCYRVDLSS